MLEVFYEAFIHIFAVSLIAAVTGCFALAGARAVGQGMSARSAWRTIFWLGVLLAVWFTFDIIAAKAGLMTWAPAKLAPPVLSVILAVMPVLLLVLAAAIGPARRVARHLGQAELMGLQGFRILGWFFLVGWAVGDIPAVFAFPAALGDIWAGLEGIRAARKVRNGSADAERAVLRANIIGLGDFAVAVTLGLFTIEGTFNLLSPLATIRL